MYASPFINSENTLQAYNFNIRAMFSPKTASATAGALETFTIVSLDN